MATVSEKSVLQVSVRQLLLSASSANSECSVPEFYFTPPNLLMSSPFLQLAQLLICYSQIRSTLCNHHRCGRSSTSWPPAHISALKCGWPSCPASRSSSLCQDIHLGMSSVSCSLNILHWMRCSASSPSPSSSVTMGAKWDHWTFKFRYVVIREFKQLGINLLILDGDLESLFPLGAGNPSVFDTSAFGSNGT